MIFKATEVDELTQEVEREGSMFIRTIFQIYHPIGNGTRLENFGHDFHSENNVLGSRSKTRIKEGELSSKIKKKESVS